MFSAELYAHQHSATFLLIFLLGIDVLFERPIYIDLIREIIEFLAFPCLV